MNQTFLVLRTFFSDAFLQNRLQICAAVYHHNRTEPWWKQHSSGVRQVNLVGWPPDQFYLRNVGAGRIFWHWKCTLSLSLSECSSEGVIANITGHWWPIGKLRPSAYNQQDGKWLLVEQEKTHHCVLLEVMIGRPNCLQLMDTNLSASKQAFKWFRGISATFTILEEFICWLEQLTQFWSQAAIFGATLLLWRSGWAQRLLVDQNHNYFTKSSFGR